MVGLDLDSVSFNGRVVLPKYRRSVVVCLDLGNRRIGGYNNLVARPLIGVTSTLAYMGGEAIETAVLCVMFILICFVYSYRILYLLVNSSAELAQAGGVDWSPPPPGELVETTPTGKHLNIQQLDQTNVSDSSAP